MRGSANLASCVFGHTGSQQPHCFRHSSRARVLVCPSSLRRAQLRAERDAATSDVMCRRVCTTRVAHASALQEAGRSEWVRSVRHPLTPGASDAHSTPHDAADAPSSSAPAGPSSRPARAARSSCSCSCGPKCRTNTGCTGTTRMLTQVRTDPKLPRDRENMSSLPRHFHTAQLLLPGPQLEDACSEHGEHRRHVRRSLLHAGRARLRLPCLRSRRPSNTCFAVFPDVSSSQILA